MRRWIVVVAGLFAALTVLPAWAGVVVPPGNRSAQQPDVPFGSASRTRAMKTTYEAKYRKVFGLLQRDQALRDKIRAAAAQFGIDPIHVAGAIVGEHTYNVDAYDRLQTYYVKAIAYLNSSFAFTHDGENVDDFIQRPQFAPCADLSDSYDRWTCRETIWNTRFRGKSVDGKGFPNNRFSAVFFQPFYAGQTFGIGQLNPLTALMMSDFVHDRTGLPRLDHKNAQEVYRTIMDPDRTLTYVAATLRKSIDAYETIAGFDISKNPGITSTLYNVGDPEGRARALKTENAARARRGEAPRLPEENYYGWLVNDKLPELRELFPSS
ncbi:DUF1402 family protein [Aquibium carbonis]|uniref:DUF1402 family protein n=1 Tax=Aquibium carbonis TaxID=2495581 RepID=A0A3S0ABS0_9HYPH|nr:DUF1402 family protein [Aquibium carbonis]RST88126.1 DUF1402 family protein [Aquibium carbonis]